MIAYFFFAQDIAERTLNRCSSALERGYSFADSAYGTDEQVLCETSSLTGYYSDPFSSALTPVKEVETTPSKETGEEIPKCMYSRFLLLSCLFVCLFV